MTPEEMRGFVVVMRELGVAHASTPEWSIHLGPPTDPVTVDAGQSKPIVRDTDDRRKFGHVSGFRGAR